MSVSGVGSSLSPAALLNLIENGPTQSNSALSGGNSSLGALLTGSSSSGDSVQISGPAQLYSQLQQLQSQNPTSFKQVTSEIASQLQAASAQATGGEAGFLANLASKFQTAANTGSASPLQPSQAGSSLPGTYNQQGQLDQALLSTLDSSDGSSSSDGLNIAQLLGGGSTSSSGLNIAQLFGGGSSSSSGSNIAQLLGGGSSSSSAVDLGQLFTNISQEVNQASSGQS
jgi:hypothetical protein